MAGQRIGYIRVSSLDQQVDRQLDGMELDQSFTDKASGKDAKRPQLEQLLRFPRKGDIVFVHSMDRLARNLDDLRRIVHTLTGKGVRIEFMKEHLSFTGEDSPMASLLLSVMGAFAEFERALIHERQREGITLAKQQGATRDAKRPSPPKLPCSYACVLRQASARQKWPVSLGSAGKPSTNICRTPDPDQRLSEVSPCRWRHARHPLPRPPHSPLSPWPCPPHPLLSFLIAGKIADPFLDGTFGLVQSTLNSVLVDHANLPTGANWHY
jgi:hypothetical protein